MRKNQQAPAGVRQAPRQCRALEPQRVAFAAQRQGRRQRVVGGGEVVAEQPFSAATSASRFAFGRVGGSRSGLSAGPSRPSSASMLPPTSRATPRTFL